MEITGRVEPVDRISLSTQASGQVRSVRVAVGDEVTTGQVLVTIDSADLQIRLARQQASLRRAQINLDELLSPANTLTALEAENRLEVANESKISAEDDLEKAYEDGFNAVSSAFLDLPGAITKIDSILGASYLSANSVRSRYGSTASDYRDHAVNLYYAAEDLHDDVLNEYRAANRNSSVAVIEKLINRTYDSAKATSDAVKSLSNFLDYVEREAGTDHPPVQLASDQAEVSGLTAAINSHLSDLLGVRNTIKVSSDNIRNAERDIAFYREKVLDIFAGADSPEVERARIEVEQARLDVQDTLVQISDRSVTAPIDGIVTSIDAKVGELVTVGTPVASVISNNTYQVSANLTESDLAKVALGAPAEIQLDSYSRDAVFTAVVSSIDPAETIIDGVPVYQITLQFIDEDERIKSGLTADVVIRGDRRDDVFAVPQRAVIQRSQGRFVQILRGDEVVEQPVKTGLRGSDGNIEITDGLVGGEQVIVFIED